MTAARRLLAAAAACLLVLAPSGCGRKNGPPYANNDLQLLTAYAAKEICSCVFVMGQSDEFCGRWTRANPNLKTWRVDRDKKTVETQAVLYWGARARYVSPREGCVAE